MAGLSRAMGLGGSRYGVAGDPQGRDHTRIHQLRGGPTPPHPTLLTLQCIPGRLPALGGLPGLRETGLSRGFMLAWGWNGCHSSPGPPSET